MKDKIATVRKLEIYRYIDNEKLKVEDSISIEEPLEIVLNSATLDKPKSISITMRTPGDDKALALGFLMTEGIINNMIQIESVKVGENKIIIGIKSDVTLDLKKLDRHFYTSSSCGVCGKSSIESVNTISDYEPTYHNLSIRSEVIKLLPAALREAQDIFLQTGGLHAAALCDINGSIISITEDVGRHNALDKLIGHQFIKDTLPLDKSIVLLSGRISFELVQKSIMAGVQCIVAVGAPSSLAVELADEYDVTIVGFAKANKFNVYTGHHRIQ
jgi:FdhD protein